MSASEPHPVDFGELRRTSPISPYWGFDRGTPIDRYYIEAFLAEHARDIQGAVLEFGDDSYARRFGGDLVTKAAVLDVDVTNTEAAYHEDLATGGGLPAHAFDCVICTQTLHLMYDLHAAIAALWSALKPGEVILATLPGSRDPSRMARLLVLVGYLHFDSAPLWRALRRLPSLCPRVRERARRDGVSLWARRRGPGNR